MLLVTAAWIAWLVATVLVSAAILTSILWEP